MSSDNDLHVRAESVVKNGKPWGADEKGCALLVVCGAWMVRSVVRDNDLWAGSVTHSTLQGSLVRKT